MKYKVSWKNSKTGGLESKSTEIVEAKTNYEAKTKFLAGKVIGTKFEKVRIADLIKIVVTKSLEDGREKFHAENPEDLQKIKEELEKEEKDAIFK